jgi:hypothetical protein
MADLLQDPDGGHNPGGVRNSFLLCAQDRGLPWAERERVLQEVAVLLLLCEESEGGG